MLTNDALPALAGAFDDAHARIDGWLIFDFRGTNPIMSAVVGADVVGSRRAYAYFPRRGTPTAIVHAVDAELWRDWPAEWNRKVWIERATLESELHSIVSGKTIAIEYSPGGEIPYGDYVPLGVAEMLRAAGATLVSSADLVTRYCSVWTPAEIASHHRAAEHVAAIARSAFNAVGEAVRAGTPLTEHELAARVLASFARAGLVTEGEPSVSYGANAARIHYAPTAHASALLVPGALLLLDLWAREPDGVFADQTWMASIGEATPQAEELWQVVREARDAAIMTLRSSLSAGTPVTGADADRASRAVIDRAGLGGRVVCRTGHSIDRVGIHGVGPALDDTESHDVRRIVTGAGFSIEPGVYVPGEIGVRTEVNAYAADRDLVVTPSTPQQELMVV